MTTQAVTEQSRRNFASEIILDAVQRAERLLSPHGVSEEQFFEGFEALVWIWSPGSTAALESINLDPTYARESLHLDFQIHVALKMAERYQEVLLKGYAAMARSVALMLSKKSTTQGREMYAAVEVKRSMALLDAHRHIAPETPLPSGVGVIAKPQPPTWASSPLLE